jgi:predicted RecA/RadA family phage recombinase
MKNRVQRGITLNYTNNSGSEIKSGDVVVLKSRVAVAVTDISQGKTGSIDTEGVFRLPKSSGAIEFSDDVYYDTVAKKITKTPGANTKYAGMAAENASSDAESIEVKLLPGSQASE